MVAVLPGILPASINVAPNSPNERANAKTVPAATPGQARGIVTDQKIFHSEAPSVRAAFSILISTCSKAPRAVIYISGKAITAALITVAGQENTTLAPNISSVLIVPKDNSLVFGNYFQINAEPWEIITSAATVNDIDIVSAVTAAQLSVSGVNFVGTP